MCLIQIYELWHYGCPVQEGERFIEVCWAWYKGNVFDCASCAEPGEGLDKVPAPTIMGSGVRCPRMCAMHEKEFEDGIKSNFRSEIRWLRPRIDSLGEAASADLTYMEDCVLRLWSLYLQWKFFYGWSLDEDGCRPDMTEGIEEVRTDMSNTIERLRSRGPIDYEALQWGLTNLLTPHRKKVHPPEMI